MPSIHFTGQYYNGFDGPTQYTFDHEGVYEVSQEKADQLTQDFPHEFAPVIEAETVDTAPAKASGSDEASKQAAESAATDKTPAKGK
jgi:hypothetical protein